MFYAYSAADAPQPEGRITVPPGRSLGGMAIGILVVEAWYPMVPGNVANAGTYDFPVMYKIVEEASIAKIMQGDPDMLVPIKKSAEDLVKQGARAIVGACGSFANYQQGVAEAVDVPVYLSVMLQAPLIMQGLKPDQKLGVVAASAAALTSRVFEQCHITDPSRLIITEAMGLPEFQALARCQGGFDSRKLERELVDLTGAFVREHPEIGALLLQCSDLPPYAWAIQQATGRPVFDMNSLIDWVHYALVRKPYAGIV